MERHIITCPLCECMCGLQVDVEGQEVKLIRPDRDDVWSKGYICPKGTTLGKLHADPDRIRVPMIRDVETDTWREVSWDEAFAKCEELIHGVVQRHGIESCTAFVGNPAGHNFDLQRYMALLIGNAGFHHIYSAGTVDQWPKNLSCVLMYGNMWKIPTPDIQRTDYLVVMGGNPQASGGSLMACPDVLGEFDKIRDRGGKVIVIDPRRTGTADRADEWVPILPGGDAAFLLAMCQVLFEEDLVDLGSVADIVKGVEVVRELCADVTPESVEAFTRVPADTIRRIAREFAAAPTGAVYGRIGLCNQEFGTLASYLVDVVNILVGKFDQPGGLMFGNPINWPIAWMASTKQNGMPEFGRWKSRVSGVPEVLGQVPCGVMAEEIAVPGDGQIKALVTVAGNPVISVPDSAKLEEALPLLECMISIDNYLNETTRFAHVLLPGASPLEQPHYDDIMWGWAARSAGKWSDAIFPREDGVPTEAEVLTHLGWLFMGKTNADFDFSVLDDAWFGALCRSQGLDVEEVKKHYEGGGGARIVDLTIRTGPWGDRYGENPDGLTLEKIKATEHGVDMGPLIPRAREMVCTPDDMIDLAPEYITADVPRLLARAAAAAAAVDDDGLLLVSRRHIRSKNTWMHNVKVLVKGKDRCTLLVHPDDAAAASLVDGGLARVSSEAGSIEVPVEVSDEMMPGVVSLPHGWGHDRPGTRLSVAREHAGVNNNLLAPAHFYDPLSNNHAVNGIPVEVVPA
ncbi:MAG: molybdopterin oxidoreductase family protein [Acidimicrobiia bacterium]